MKSILIITIILVANFKLVAQDSLNMNLLFHWDEDSIHSYQTWGSMAQQYNEIWGYYDSTKNREYAIIGSAEGTYIWDVTNTDSAFLADYELGRDTAEIHRDFKTYKHYLYGVADEGSSSLQIFDLSYLPDSVHKVYDSQEFLIQSHNCFIENGRLYICTPYVLGSTPSLRILDIATNPEKPVLLKDFKLQTGQGNHVHDLYVRNNIAYCSDGFDGLFIFDMNDLDNIFTIGSITTYTDKNYNHSSWLSEDGKTLFFVDEKHAMRIKAYDISNINNLEEIALFESNAGAMPHNIFVNGYKLYVSYYHDGVWVFDISDPRNPETIAYYDTYIQPNGYDSYQGCWGVYPYLPSGKILASDFSNGLFVLSDTSVTKNPPNNIAESINHEVKMYPTLVENKTSLMFSKMNSFDSYLIFDDLGREIYKEVLKENISIKMLDFSFLAKGNYFILLKGLNKTQTIKFVKK